MTSTIMGIKYLIVWLKNKETLSIQFIGKSSLLATFWDPPIPATMKPLTLICVFLIAVQSVNNLIIDWRNPKEKQYDPSKDLK